MMNTSRRNPATTWRLSALTTACALLSGCAALQIDVDVYKGPLVHDEETQVQQLASIAMSGKAVMLLQRNSWLNTLKPNWAASVASSKALRTRHITKGEWEQLGLQDGCHDKAALCRNTRLINDMLSAYEDRTEPGLGQELESVGDSFQCARMRILAQLYAIAFQRVQFSLNRAADVYKNIREKRGMRGTCAPFGGGIDVVTQDTPHRLARRGPRGDHHRTVYHLMVKIDVVRVMDEHRIKVFLAQQTLKCLIQFHMHDSIKPHIGEIPVPHVIRADNAVSRQQIPALNFLNCLITRILCTAAIGNYNYCHICAALPQ